MAKRLTKQEIIDRSRGTLEGSVWVLREAGVPYSEILAWVKKASDEWDPSAQPAFVIKPGEGEE